MQSTDTDSSRKATRLRLKELGRRISVRVPMSWVRLTKQRRSLWSSVADVWHAWRKERLSFWSDCTTPVRRLKTKTMGQYTVNHSHLGLLAESPRWALVRHWVTIFPWLGGVMVTASDLRSTGRGFDSQPFHYQVATVGQLLFAPWAWAYSTLHP